MKHKRKELAPIYEATTYVAERTSGTRLPIRIGQRHPDLDRWLDTLSVESWAFITACNPRSEEHTDAWNEQAMVDLKAELRAKSYVFVAGYGQGDDASWPPERSFLILGITREEATALAERYGQNAYVYGESGSAAELVWTSVAEQNTQHDVLLHIPHSSVDIPDEWRATFVVGAGELARELLVMTDRYTDELFALPGHADRLVFPVSRLLVDAERFLSDADEPMAERGMGVVYTRTHDGRILKSDRDRETLIARYYVPHHAEMATWVNDRLENFGRCLLIDCHSFPSSPLPCDLDQMAQRPDICIGTTAPHSGQELVRSAVEAFAALGYTVDVNRPYAGTIVPLSMLDKNPACSSIMIEVNRRLYMNEHTGEHLPTFCNVASGFTDALQHIVAYWHSAEAKTEDDSHSVVKEDVWTRQTRTLWSS